MVASFVGWILHIIIVHYVLHGLVTRSNPWSYMKHILPAQTMALACASSAATIPVTFRSVDSTGVIPKPVARFIVPLGATINMDGGAIYFPCAVVWLGMLNGNTPNLGQFILLAIISTIGSAGAAPVPSSGLVLIITMYNTVFGGSGTPAGFSFVVAIDWLMDRVITAMNVTGDTVVAHMVSSLLPEDEVKTLVEANAEDGVDGAEDSARELASVEVVSDAKA